MKKIDLGQAIGILANLGVIAGILFLVVELQQNNELLAAQSRTERLGVQTDYLNSLYQNEDLASLMVRAKQGGELTDIDRFRASYLGERLLVALQFVYGEADRGLIDFDAISAEEWSRAFHDVPLMDETWRRRKSSLPENFVNFMDESVVNR